MRVGQAIKKGIVVRALHKSASMFLYHFFQQVCNDANIDYFSANHAEPNEDLVASDIDSSFCVCPVRHFEQTSFVHFQNINDVTQIYHVRDPRDMIVSEYFSYGWTHPDEYQDDKDQHRRDRVRSMTIDEYALNQPEFSMWPIEEKFVPMLELGESGQAGSDRMIIVKYETMVTRFAKWVTEVIRPFQFKFPRMQIAKYALRYRNEFKPSSESMSHKRRITPGDHREKLKRETIRVLNERYKAILERFDYPE